MQLDACTCRPWPRFLVCNAANGRSPEDRQPRSCSLRKRGAEKRRNNGERRLPASGGHERRLNGACGRQGGYRGDRRAASSSSTQPAARLSRLHLASLSRLPARRSPTVAIARRWQRAGRRLRRRPARNKVWSLASVQVRIRSAGRLCIRSLLPRAAWLAGGYFGPWQTKQTAAC